MKNIKKKYDAAKAAKIGENCECPSCGSMFIKTNYQQAFCKTKKGTVCKDKYWNTVTPEKRNNKTRISPANAAWMERKEVDKMDLIDRELNEDGSWDAHQCYVERCKFCERINCQCEDLEYYNF